MSSFFSPPPPSPPPPPPAPVTPSTIATPEAAARDRRRPMGLGTIATSFRGLLDEAAPVRRKSLLGE
jgi:hypothetical protein